MTLLVGTEKGLFRLVEDAAAGRWVVDGPHMAGYSVLHTMVAGDDTLYAATGHKIWGEHVYRSRAHGRTWSSRDAIHAHAAETGRGPTKAIWYLAESGNSLFAGIDPAGLFRSDDGGETWSPVDGLNEHPTRATWEPSKGCFAVHSICIERGSRVSAGNSLPRRKRSASTRSRDATRSVPPTPRFCSL